MNPNLATRYTIEMFADYRGRSQMIVDVRRDSQTFKNICSCRYGFCFLSVLSLGQEGRALSPLSPSFSLPPPSFPRLRLGRGWMEVCPGRGNRRYEVRTISSYFRCVRISYKRPCPSVGRSVGRSVRWSVGNAFVSR